MKDKLYHGKTYIKRRNKTTNRWTVRDKNVKSAANRVSRLHKTKLVHASSARGRKHSGRSGANVYNDECYVSHFYTVSCLHPEAVEITISNCHYNPTIHLYANEHLSCQLNQQNPPQTGSVYKMHDTIQAQNTVLSSLAGRPWPFRAGTWANTTDTTCSIRYKRR